MVRNCAPENLEIPGLLLTHHPGMTGKRLPQEKRPRLPAGPLLTPGLPNSLFLVALAALLLARAIALARVLLLLSGFLATTLLRVALAGILTLLTRILVLLLRHSGKLPCWTSEGRQRPASTLVASGTGFLAGPREPGAEMISVQALRWRPGQLQPPVPSCYKTQMLKGCRGPRTLCKSSL
ncbi:hypothetical protein ABH999_007227 [Bradyrhizobium yuanmingense]|uniref:Uncharacterized protein n=1 Tax=Bradyrhizobium yuanmingense TaxID=108015 RepID=A0A1C3XBL0_9BRAD|nr:hypothetical protein IQ15_06500 [Bradyrhizobium yuanmingense]SCB49354.1 hypothetical protein GA0061099_101140 [Bradyrhizobium yuanmingense]